MTSFLSCAWPAHTRTKGDQSVSTTTEQTIKSVRVDLVKAAVHWSTVANEHEPKAVKDETSATVLGASLMAASYCYALAALLGQMAETEREGGERWTAESAAEFVQDLIINGDTDNFNADVMPEENR